MIKFILSGIYAFLLTIFAVETLQIDPNSLCILAVAMIAGRIAISKI